jgi:hypothetical protein
MVRSLIATVLALVAAAPASAGAPPPLAPAPFHAPAPISAPPRRPNSLGADWRLQQDEARLGVQNRQLMPLGRVIEQVRRRAPGRELDAGLEQFNGRPTYRLRWMTRDGRRIDYLIDATTGAMVRGD